MHCVSSPFQFQAYLHPTSAAFRTPCVSEREARHVQPQEFSKCLQTLSALLACTAVLHPEQLALH